MIHAKLWTAALATVLALAGAAVTAPVEAQGLDFNQVLFDDVGGVDGLNGPRIVDTSPDGRHVYVVSETDDSVAVFERDVRTGALTFVDAAIDGVDGVVGLNFSVALEVSPDGRNLYATTAPGTLVVFARDPETGELTWLETEFNNVNGVSGIGFGVWIQVSPDGEHVYVAAVADDAVAVFDRDPQTGEVTWASKVQNGVDGIVGLNGAFPMDMSHDGGQLYAAGIVDDALQVFSRDRRTGALTSQQILVNGVGGVQGMDGPREVRISPDGRNVYVAALFGSSVAVFARHPGSGELTFVEAHFDDQGPIQHLQSAVSVEPSADGRRVYAASFDEDAIVVFDRDPATGRLTFVEEVVNGLGGVQGLGSPICLISSRDSRNLYSVNFFADSLVAFDVSH